jgi:hypothetical protein
MVVPLGVVSQETDWQNAKCDISVLLVAILAEKNYGVHEIIRGVCCQDNASVISPRGHPALARDEEKCCH